MEQGHGNPQASVIFQFLNFSICFVLRASDFEFANSSSAFLPLLPAKPNPPERFEKYASHQPIPVVFQ